jgi:hypothetical protein
MNLCIDKGDVCTKFLGNLVVSYGINMPACFILQQFGFRLHILRNISGAQSEVQKATC